MTPAVISNHDFETDSAPMLESSETNIFISHGWDWNEHYSKVLEWLSSARDLNWRNCSFACHGGMTNTSVNSLKKEMTRQIQSADIVLILGGMHPPRKTYTDEKQYAGHRKWIQHQIREAARLHKKVIGVKSWDGSTIPSIIRDASVCKPVKWDRDCIVKEVKRQVLDLQSRSCSRPRASQRPLGRSEVSDSLCLHERAPSLDMAH